MTPPNNIREITLLSAVSANTTGDYVPTHREKGWTFYIYGLGVTTGATVKIQARAGGVNFDIHEEAVTGDITKILYQNNAQYKEIRASVTNRTDGTYTVIAHGGTKG